MNKTIEPVNKIRDQLAQMVLNRAMKGVHRGFPNGTLEEIETFRNQFSTLAYWVADMMPRDLSATVGAVTFKAALFYGVDKAQHFCETMTKGTFNGADDPAHLLWKSLNKNRGKEKAVANYQRAVCAARVYCEGRRVKNLTLAKSDIFEWGPGLTIPEGMQDGVKHVLDQVRRLMG